MLGQDDERNFPMPSAMARLDSALNRFDDVLEQRLRREKAAIEREDAARADAARARARADANDCREHAVRYDSAFQSFGVETPQAKDCQDPDDFRCRLFLRLLRRLPDDHPLQGVDPAELPEIALDNFEQQLLEAAKIEGDSPSLE
jgi:hypothetical protein